MPFYIILVFIYFLVAQCAQIQYNNHIKNLQYNFYFNFFNNNYKNKVCFLKFSEFQNFFKVNKKKWGIDKNQGIIYYKTSDKQKIFIKFNKKDYFKAVEWISNMIENNENCFNENYSNDLIELLENIQIDINEAKEESRKQIEEGRKAFLETKSRIGKEFNQTNDESKIDSILIARTTEQNN